MRRMVFILPLAAFMALLSYFAAGLKRDPSLIPAVLINQPVPAFDLPPIEGYAEGLDTGGFKRRCHAAQYIRLLVSALPH